MQFLTILPIDLCSNHGSNSRPPFTGAGLSSRHSVVYMNEDSGSSDKSAVSTDDQERDGNSNSETYLSSPPTNTAVEMSYTEPGTNPRYTDHAAILE